MDLKPSEMVGWGIAGGGGLMWMISQLFRVLRRDNSDHKIDVTAQGLIDQLTQKNNDLHDQLDAKELTIQRLFAEKEANLKQLAEIPQLKNQIEELEGKIDTFTNLVVGMNKLMTHLLLEADLAAMPQEIREMIKEQLPELQAGAVGV